MSGSGERSNRIRIEQVRIGLHIKLDSWLGHPFLFSTFKITSEQQIAALKLMGLTDIEYIPGTSDCPPAPLATQRIAPQNASGDDGAAALDELMRMKNERIRSLHQERGRIRAAERKYVKTENTVKNVMRLAKTSPALAAQLSGELAGELSELFLSEQNPYIHLMGDNAVDESAYFHSVNVTVLSLILARALGITSIDTLRDVAQGALLHDVGKTMLPTQLLLKDDDLTVPESNLLKMHPVYGVKLLQQASALRSRVREIIMFHHELCDGSGYPKGIDAGVLDQAVRIVTLADTYDNLCNQRSAKRSRTPTEALSHMYKNELAKFDRTALSAFIKVLGIYPPGTIVKLTSGKIGIVMSVDATDLLHPNLMIYDPAIPKEDAAIVHLKRDLDETIERSLRPAALPDPVSAYLSPRKHICYFVGHSD